MQSAMWAPNGTTTHDNSDNELTVFERRAQLIKPYFNHKLRHNKEIIPPPMVYEFLGTPNAEE